MKSKIVLKIPMKCQKCKKKALQIAAEAYGVSSVALGEEEDKVVVIGEGIDAIKLARKLRKKFKAADIVTLVNEK